MSEDEETKCKLTYREGMRIAGFYAILGERAARKALAEANEEKDERWTRE